MNREIKFRGKRDDTNEWHYWEVLMGHKLKYNSVVLETIGQYTGLKDKNGKEIYEGDIVELYDEFIGEIVFRFGGFVYQDKVGITFLGTLHREIVKIIGNIHENEELLEREEQ